jgi:TPR repeat protein
LLPRRGSSRLDQAKCKFIACFETAQGLQELIGLVQTRRFDYCLDMKLAALSLMALAMVLPVSAQYSARTLTRRIAPQTGIQPPPQRPVQPAPAPGAVAPAPAQPPGPYVKPNYNSPPATDAEKVEAEKKLLKYQKMRAEAGSDNAQYEMGMRYLTGKGVEQDETQAKAWFEKAAKQGNTLATKKLEEINKGSVEISSAKPLTPGITAVPQK